MRRVAVSAIVIGIIALLGYLWVWPVPNEPVAWQSPPNPGYTGKFARNDRLKALEFLDLGGKHGPEDIAVDRQGRIYAATQDGIIVRLRPDGTSPEDWVDTKGRPLGIDFDNQENLIVADAMRGLLAISPDGQVTVLATEAAAVPIAFADDVDVAADGKIYFSDASTKFGAKEFGGTMEAAVLDIVERGSHGRLLVYDPATGKTDVLLKSLNFANGVAVSHDQRSVLVNETASYRVIRFWINGPRKGSSEPLIEGLPAFPDNISTGLDGRYWVALVIPRNDLLDGLSDKPFLRKVIQRLPEPLRPKTLDYGHVIAIDDTGEVVKDLQDPNSRYPRITSATETKDYLYLGSLRNPVLARLPKSKNSR